MQLLQKSFSTVPPPFPVVKNGEKPSAQHGEGRYLKSGRKYKT